MLTETELKVLRLALDENAGDGEWRSAAVKFFLLARKRGVKAEAFEANGTAPLVIPQTQPDWGLTVFPIGKKHKGELFKDIPASYLSNFRGWILDDPQRAIDLKNLADAIEAFLKQSS